MGRIDGLVEDRIVRFTDGHEISALKCFTDVIESPSGPLDLILKLFDFNGELSLEFSHLLLRVDLARDEFLLKVSHHQQETVIELVLIIDLLKVLLEDALLELDFLLTNDHLVLLRENANPLKKFGEIMHLNNCIIYHTVASTSSFRCCCG